MAPRRRAIITLTTAFALVLLTLLPGPGRGQARLAVDVAIVLAVDCSYSVDGEEFRLQMDGLAEAFRSQDVQSAILAGPNGRVAITLVQWSGSRSQEVAVPWMVVASTSDADVLANLIATAPRRTAEGATSLTGAIDAGVVLHLKSPIDATRRVIDISSDGYNNSGAKPDQARNRAISIGLTINGLTILTEYWYLHHYFRNHIIGGPGSFVLKAEDYSAYREAIRRKLVLEIMGPTV